MIIRPIQPGYQSGNLQTIGAAGTGSASINAAAKQVILTNLGANPVYVRIGNGVTAADTKDYPVPAGAQVVVSKGGEDNSLAWNSPLGTTLHFMTGEGF